MKHLNIRIYGKVQGVYYRASAQEEALRLGVKGFVRNEPDGCVYLEVEGDEAQLDQLTSWCWMGPPRAKIDKIEVEEGALVKFKEFEIRR